MEPIITSISVIVGKYLIDQGLELGKTFGPKALEIAEEITKKIIDRMLAKQPELTKQIIESPTNHKQDLEREIEVELDINRQLAIEMKKLITELQEEIRHYSDSQNGTLNPNQGIPKINAVNNSIVATSGGIAVGGDVKGSININDTSKQK